MTASPLVDNFDEESVLDILSPFIDNASIPTTVCSSMRSTLTDHDHIDMVREMEESHSNLVPFLGEAPSASSDYVDGDGQQRGLVNNNGNPVSGDDPDFSFASPAAWRTRSKSKIRGGNDCATSMMSDRLF
jgi:hypothetical protein